MAGVLLLVLLAGIQELRRRGHMVSGNQGAVRRGQRLQDRTSGEFVASREHGRRMVGREGRGEHRRPGSRGSSGRRRKERWLAASTVGSHELDLGSSRGARGRQMDSVRWGFRAGGRIENGCLRDTDGT